MNPANNVKARYGWDDIAAIDDGRKDEGRMFEVVHHVDGDAGRPGPRRYFGSDVARARAEDRDDAGEIGGQRIAIGQFDP